MIWTAFALGLFGSLHCVGMCGPLALAAPGQHNDGLHRALSALLYNIGRTLTYAVIGFGFGLMGETLRIAGVQSALSVAMGILLLLMAFFALDLEQRLMRFSTLQWFYGFIRMRLASLLQSSHNTTASLRFGILNGFLPCGLVYAALFGAISFGSLADTVLYMTLFGLGTLPLMFSVALAGQWLSVRWRNRLRSLVPVFLTFMAVMLIARGLNFDLPYDFRFWQDAADHPMCH